MKTLTGLPGFFGEGHIEEAPHIPVNVISIDWPRVVAVVRSSMWDEWYEISADVEELSGSCSCPVGYNCKHVAALLLRYRTKPAEIGMELAVLKQSILDALKTRKPEVLELLTRYVLTDAEFRSQLLGVPKEEEDE